MKSTYEDFLASKRILAAPCGFDIPLSRINPRFFPFQKDVCRFDLERGKAGNFLHTGMGKGPIQMEWCAHVSEHAKGDTLIGAPLAVAEQFAREAKKFNYDVNVCKDQSGVRRGINVTNYDRLESFDLSKFVGVALDESSCIKDWTSKTAQTLIERLALTPYKLCASATPSPNDHAELGTHAELLDVMRRSAMLAMFFEHDGGETSKWAPCCAGRLLLRGDPRHEELPSKERVTVKNQKHIPEVPPSAHLAVHEAAERLLNAISLQRKAGSPVSMLVAMASKRLRDALNAAEVRDAS